VTDVTTMNRKVQKADKRWSSSLRIWHGSCSPCLQKTSMLHSAMPQVGWKMGGWLNATYDSVSRNWMMVKSKILSDQHLTALWFY